MAISFVAESYGSSAGATSVTPAEPTGTAENDLILAVAFISDNTGAWTDPTDFVQIDSAVEGSGHWYIGRKVRGVTAGSGYAFSYSGVSSVIAATLITFRGVDVTTPLDVTYVNGTHYGAATNAPNTAARAITTVTDGAWVALLQAMASVISGAAGPPSGYTQRADHLTSSPGGGAAQYVATKAIATAGAETPGVFTHTDVTGTADPRNFTLALRPAAGGARHGGIQLENLNSFLR